MTPILIGFIIFTLIIVIITLILEKLPTDPNGKTRMVVEGSDGKSKTYEMSNKDADNFTEAIFKERFFGTKK